MGTCFWLHLRGQAPGHRTCSPGSVPVPVTASTSATMASAQRAHMPALPLWRCFQQKEGANAIPGAWMICLPHFACLRLPGDAQPQPPTPRQGRIIIPVQSTQQSLSVLAKKVGHVGKIRTRYFSHRKQLYFLLCTFCHSWKCVK